MICSVLVYINSRATEYAISVMSHFVHLSYNSSLQLKWIICIVLTSVGIALILAILLIIGIAVGVIRAQTG